MLSSDFAVVIDGVGRDFKIKPNKKKGETEKVLTALSSVDLTIHRGELFGLLGPNGAGKTTLIKILTTLLLPSRGKASVAGFDVLDDPQNVRRRINMVSGGETSGYGILTIRENLWMFAQLYGVTSKEAYRRIDEILEIVDLRDKAHARVSGLSTGQRQRMNFCRGFITEPEVIFLDEPTLGLDVHAANVVREFTLDWMRRRGDRTVLLTTHYMAEADELCDRLAIIDHGRTIAIGSSAELKSSVQEGNILDLTLRTHAPEQLTMLRTLPFVTEIALEQGDEPTLFRLQVLLRQGANMMSLVSALEGFDLELLSLTNQEPTLESVFLTLTGRSLRQADSVASIQQCSGKL